MNILNEAFKDKRVLLTGHTGFKGSWLSIWLNLLGAEVIGYSLDPEHDICLFELAEIKHNLKDYRGDVRDKEKLLEVFKQEQPHIVIHMAAQALVIDGYKHPLSTFETNTLGTANVLEAIRQTESVHAGIIITTDKVYENKEWIWGYRENDALGGYDPYSASKAAADIITNAYLRSFFNPKDFESHKKSIAIARAGNVIGGGDWSENRIIPDCIKSFDREESVVLRNPEFTRPWQHVLEPLGGYLLLASKMMKQPKLFSGAWNFGPTENNVKSVNDLVEAFIACLGYGKMTKAELNNPPHESKSLSLDISKASFELDWRPKLNFQETIQWTAEWYEKYRSLNIKELCETQINKYMQK